MKTKKRKKVSRMHGRKMGTHGRGARKKGKGSGHRGGKGMAGTGKRADQKKTLITKLYGHGYFGKKGVTSKSSKKDKRKRINLGMIQNNLEKLGKKVGNKWEVSLEDYKILGEGEIKEKVVIKAKEASMSAIEKIKKSGGELILNSENKKDSNKHKEED